MIVRNPILRGFNPDPSIVRVGDDYYIAVSTFEWWPGVKLYHSDDLVRWSDYGYVLTDPGTLDLRGVGPSQGIWAPCLTHCDGKFYLCYTVVRAFYANMYDTENYVVTSSSIDGPWSDPVRLDGFGFDPSLFHDEDGKKYLVSVVTDHRIPKKYGGRLILEEIDPTSFARIGDAVEIYADDSIFLEGPHILRKDGWYYLIAADTGTGEGHGESVLRSRSVKGPYEMLRAPWMDRRSDREAWSIMTSRHEPAHPLQKAGHGDLVETLDGRWYMVHIAARPSKECNPDGKARIFGHPRFPRERRYPLGRETAIEPVVWRDGWPVLEGGTLPLVDVDIPCRTEMKEEKHPFLDDFSSPVLSPVWQSLRVPMDSNHMKLDGRLRLFGRSGLASLFSQSLIARRIDSFSFVARTKVTFDPENFKQMAGLVVMYDTDNYFYLHVSDDEDAGKCVALLKAENRSYAYLVPYVPVEKGRPILLEIASDDFRFTFRYGFEEGDMRTLATGIDGTFMSDEACFEGWFTGAMTGVCCQDLTGRGKSADFSFFSYCGLDEI